MLNTQINAAIKKDSALPLYQQIKDVINAKVTEGQWLAGQKIPSENELVESLDVSRMTVHRALRELTKEGTLNRVHGLGTFVSQPTQHASLIQLRDIADEIRAQDKQHTSKILMHLKIKAAALISQKMQLPEHSDVFYLKCIHYQDEQPIQLEERYVNPQLAPEFMNNDFQLKTATRYLMELFRPDEMEHRVEAVITDAKNCELLDIKAVQPCLKLSRRTWKHSQVVTFVTMLYPGHRYDLAAKYSTNDYKVLKN